MNTFCKQFLRLASGVMLSASLVTLSLPVGATEQGEQRRDARDTRQDARQGSRTNKADCRAANDKSNAECRQEKRNTKQGARQQARDIKY